VVDHANYCSDNFFLSSALVLIFVGLMMIIYSKFYDLTSYLGLWSWIEQSFSVFHYLVDRAAYILN
jgi:hypothetical protein